MNSLLAGVGVILISTQVVLLAFGFGDDTRVSQRSIIASYIIGLLASFGVGIALIVGAPKREPRDPAEVIAEHTKENA